MREETRKYPTANGAPEEPTFFCPFAPLAIPGPLGKLTITHAPCDIKNCALGHGMTDLCSFLHICNMLDQLGGCVLQLRPAIEKIAPYLKQLSDRLDLQLKTNQAILTEIHNAKT